jgi:undecaprenyl-diphosphatase
MSAFPRRSLLLAAALLAGFVVLAVLVTDPGTVRGVQVVDDHVHSAVPSLWWGPATWVAKALSLIGGSLVLWPARGLVVLLLAWRRSWRALAAFALAVLTSEALIGPLKAAIDRPRPPGALIVTSGASFPSGHGIASAVTAIGAVLVLLPPGPRRRPWELAAVLFAVAVGCSRVYLAAHWLSDVVAGLLLGSGLAIGWPALLQLTPGRARGSPALRP